MQNFYQQMIDLFTSPPGNLIYHIVLAFAVTAAIQGVLISRRAAQAEFLGRALFGLGFVLAGQVLLFITSGLAWQGLANPHVFLPPLDRAVTLFSILWIAWIWAFPRPARLADGLVGLASVIVLIAFFFTLNQWSGQPSSNVFNGSGFDVAWEIAALAVLLVSILVLILRRSGRVGHRPGILAGQPGRAHHSIPVARPPAVIFPASCAWRSCAVSRCCRPWRSACGARFFARRAGSPPPGPRFNLRWPRPAIRTGTELEPGIVRERRRYSADPRAVHAFLDVALAADPGPFAGRPHPRHGPDHAGRHLFLPFRPGSFRRPGLPGGL